MAEIYCFGDTEPLFKCFSTTEGDRQTKAVSEITPYSFHTVSAVWNVCMHHSDLKGFHNTMTNSGVH